MPLSLLPFPKISTNGLEASGRDDWVATEKIHGAQLVVGASADEIRVGKRKAWLRADEAFFGWQMLRPLLQGAARAIHHALGSTGELWMYGELFGGHYPHPAVSAVVGLVPVQTGIWYAPDLRYCVFDIVHGRAGEEPMFLAHERVQELAHIGGLTSVPLLARGRLSDLGQLPVRFPTRVPDLLGLPALAQNAAEGYVLKPAEQASVSKRHCAKLKIPEFDEQRFDESSAFDADLHLSRESLFALASQLVNAARLASARSKVGEDPQQVVEEVVLDSLVDLADLFRRRMEALTPAEESELLAHLKAQAEALWKTHADRSATNARAG